VRDGEYLHKPCPECPFTRGPKAVRVRRGRIIELTGLMLGRRGGGEFSCHNTVEYCDTCDEQGEGCPGHQTESRHCAGALIFAEKHGTSTQMMRVAQRLRLYDPARLEGKELVFDTVEEMLATAVDAPERQKARR
jgi:hypothetical protein